MSSITRCLDRMDAKLRGHSETIGQRMERDLDALLPLPDAPYDACDKRASRVSSLSLVRYRTNDYSVPVAYGHCDVLVRGYVNEVVISCAAEVIAKHSRSYERDDLSSTPSTTCRCWSGRRRLWTRPPRCQGWELPEEYRTLRRLLEARMGRRGKREFVQVLRLLETFSHQEVHHAVKDALRLGAHQLRRGEAPAAVPPGRPPAQAGPGALSLPAPGQREDHPRPRLYDPAVGAGGMSNQSTLLLEHHLKELKLPTFLREYRKLAGQCAAEGADHPDYLLRLSEFELIDRHQRMVERRIRAARFSATKSLDTFDFLAIPSVNKPLVMQLARCEYIERQ